MTHLPDSSRTSCVTSAAYVCPSTACAESIVSSVRTEISLPAGTVNVVDVIAEAGGWEWCSCTASGSWAGPGAVASGAAAVWVGAAGFEEHPANQTNVHTVTIIRIM